ncbi:MAG: GNAT family N-acetyltransferase [Solirubrobacteraceae bacterium]
MRRELPDGFELDDDPTRIDLDAVYAYISGESYWGRGRTREFVRSAVEGSQRVVGLYLDDEQVGFARAVSDGTTMAYLADVYVLAPFRGRGLGAHLVREIIDGGNLAKTHWLLHTADATGFYAQLGFVKGPARYPLMERPRGYESSP